MLHDGVASLILVLALLSLTETAVAFQHPIRRMSQGRSSISIQSTNPPSVSEPIPQLDEWKILDNGRVEGKVLNHPDIENGAFISTSPLSNPSATQEMNMVETVTGSKYFLLRPTPEIEARKTQAITAMPEMSNDIQGGDAAEMSETKKLMQQVKDAGIAGVISYALWEFGFWTISVPVCIVAYRQVTGHWPNFQDSEDVKKLGAEAFAFVNVARFAVPLRIGLALGTTPWIQKNVVDRFLNKKDQESDDTIGSQW